MTMDMIQSNGGPITTAQAVKLFKEFALKSGYLDKDELTEHAGYFSDELKGHEQQLKEESDGDIAALKEALSELKARRKGETDKETRETLDEEIESAKEQLDADSACMAHEMVCGKSQGWHTTTDLMPLAAWQAGQLGLHCPPEHGWALIDLVHLQFEQGRVQVGLPVDLSATDSDALLQAMHAFFLEDGIHLHALSPGKFLAHATVFKHLP